MEGKVEIYYLENEDSFRLAIFVYEKKTIQLVSLMVRSCEMLT